MPKFPQLWEVEKQLWTGPAENYDRLMAQDCVMVFPLPAGILSRDAIIETVKMAPNAPWRQVPKTPGRRNIGPHALGPVGFPRVVGLAVAERFWGDPTVTHKCTKRFTRDSF